MNRTGTKRARIIAARKKHPDFPPVKIARLVGTDTDHVVKVLMETGFLLDSVRSLGIAARDLGFTVPMLKAIAAKNSQAVL